MKCSYVFSFTPGWAPLSGILFCRFDKAKHSSMIYTNHDRAVVDLDLANFLNFKRM